jgi:hypothetical protein
VLDFDLIGSGGAVDPGVPLFELQVSGDCAPATATAVSPAAAIGAPLPPLAAWPSVTRTGTRWVLSRPAAAGRTVDLFDLAGRRVAQLTIAAGATSAVWDGRTATGRSAPAGVYFARVAGAPGATARVLVVR